MIDNKNPFKAVVLGASIELKDAGEYDIDGKKIPHEAGIFIRGTNKKTAFMSVIQFVALMKDLKSPAFKAELDKRFQEEKEFFKTV